MTENRDKIFEQVSIPGSDKIHFKLAFEPGNFDEAVELYYEWTRQLIEKDWPFFFGPKREVIEVLPMDKGVIENQPSLLNAVKYDSPAKASACAPEKDVGPQENHHSSKIPIALEEVPKTSPDKLTLEELYDDWDKPIPESLDEVVQVRESTVRILSSLNVHDGAL